MTQRQTKKEDIFNSAVRLFSEQGFSATTIRQIAKASRANEASIYYHFENKEAMLDAILREFRFMPKSYIPSKKKIDAYLKTDTPRELLTRLVPSRSEKNRLFLSQAYRIVCMEQLVNARAKEVVEEHLIGEYSDSLCYALERLTGEGRIPAAAQRKEWKPFCVLWADNIFTRISLDGFPGVYENTGGIGVVSMGEYLVKMAVSVEIP